jgi:hypothetical protein
MLHRTLVALALTGVVGVAHAAPAGPEGAAQPAAQPTPAPAPVAGAPAQPGGPVAPAAAGASPAASVDAGPSYGVRLKLMQNKVNDLKEKVHRTKLRIEAIKEMVLRGVVAGSRALIVHKNDMGSRFRLERVVYAVDGNVIYNKTDQEGGLADKEEFEIFNGGIVPGNHTLSVTLAYRGHGFGPFTYLNQYRFTARSSTPFAAEEGKLTRLRVIGYEKGNVTTEMKDVPAVDFRTNIQSDRGEAPRK